MGLTLGQKAARVKLLILDVDGVLTGGEIIHGSGGMELKHFCTRDGMAIAQAHRAGLAVAFITGRASEAVMARAAELGVKDLFQGCADKLEAYRSLLKKYNLSDDQVTFVGDDLVDLPVMSRVGLKVAVANASGELKAVADYVTIASGGRGAVREIVDFLLGWKEREEPATVERE
ncbi:HAD-IIIA family hydrolase [bacterium]|nr:HAD-IIIA family hydrolase [bacterium]